MINNLVRAFVKIFIFLLKWVCNIVLVPFTLVIKGLLIDFSPWLEDAINFFDEYVIQAISFAREVFLNMTGFPQLLLTLSATMFLTYLSWILVLKMATFFYNIWSFFKGGATK